MKPKILYWIEGKTHIRIVSSFIERDDVEQAIMMPRYVPSKGIKIESIFKYDRPKEIKQITRKFNPDLFVQSSYSSRFHPKLPKMGARIVFVAHGIHKDDFRNLQKLESADGLKNFDLLCIGSIRMAQVFKRYTKENAIICTNALTQFDDFYTTIKDQGALRKKVFGQTEQFDKIITFFGHRCTGRSTSVPHNESYYRTAICLAELAKKHNWLVYIKPKRDGTQGFIKKLCEIEDSQFDWARELKIEYLKLRDNDNVRFISANDYQYDYFCSDAIVSTGCSTIEVETALIKKPLIKICTNSGEPVDIIGTLRHSAAYPVYDIKDLESIMLNALSGKNTIQLNQERFIRNLGITFDGKAHERAFSAMLGLL